MKRLTRLGFAIIFTAVALVPGNAEAVCTLQQCMDLMSHTDCSQYVCPQGSVPFATCNGTYCYSYCACKRCTTCS